MDVASCLKEKGVCGGGGGGGKTGSVHRYCSLAFSGLSFRHV